MSHYLIQEDEMENLIKRNGRKRKLNAAQVDEIRGAYTSNRTVVELAAQYNVSGSTIRWVLKGIYVPREW